MARNILWEGLLVACVGLGFALAANEFSPRGLSLTRNYFPVGRILPATTPLPNTNSVGSTNLTVAEGVIAELQANGLQLATSNQAAAWFTDPRRQTAKIVFVDARNEEDYKNGHIPGAWLFNPYEEEKYLNAVAPVCQAADKVLVYCHGGECDDSLSAATELRDVGVPGTNIFVYAGGMSEWLTTGRPVETGPQNSSQWLNQNP